MDTTTLLAIERAAIRAWPALETSEIGGWLWRYSAGGSQRANSVSALADPGCDVETAIDTAEALYAARAALPQFQITDVASPSDLAQRLARRGYRVNDPCTTLAAELDGGIAMPAEAVILPRADDTWLDTYTSVITANRKAIAPLILARVP
ncbi:MAG: hypothetical protein AB7F78_24505, partial [Hyphomicrobiaceae bacterium]